LPTALAVVTGGLAATFVVVLTGFAGPIALDGARLAATRFGGADRFAAFLVVFARVLAPRVGLAALRFFRVAFPRAFLEAAPAERRPAVRGAPGFGRLALRLAVGRFLAFLAMSV
jgi:hypothetical protein